MTEVIRRPKFRKLFSKDRIFTLLELLDIVDEIVDVKSKTDICRDKNDNFLLNLSKDGNADYLITEDLDLLELKKHFKTKIVKYKQFVSEIL